MIAPSLAAALAALLLVSIAALALLARLSGARLPLRLSALALVAPLVLLSPWLVPGRVLLPTGLLAEALGVGVQRPEPHALLNDSLYQFVPWEIEVRRALRAGRLPLWSDRLDGGSSPLVNPTARVWSPMALLVRALPLAHFTLASFALAVATAVLGAALLLRTLGARWPWAALGGLAYGWSGALSAWALFPQAAAAAWLPWVVATSVRLVRRPSRRRLLAATLATACLGLAGHPEVAVSGAALALAAASALFARRVGRRGFRWLLLHFGLAALLVAPLLVPFVCALPGSQRVAALAQGGEDLRPRPALLLGLVHPHAFGRPYRDPYRGPLNWAESGTLYSGLLTLAGCLAAPFARARKRTLLFLGFGAALVLLAAGLPPVWTQVPLLRFVAVERWLPAGVLALVVSGVLGFEAALRGRRRVWGALGAVAAAAASAVVAPGASALLLGALAGACALGRARFAYPLAAVLVAAELTSYSRSLLPRGARELFYPTSPAVLATAAVVEPGGFWRAVGQGVQVYPSLLAAYGIDEVRPHNPLAPAAQARVLAAAFGYAPNTLDRYIAPFSELDSPVLDFLNVRAIVTAHHQPPPPGLVLVARHGVHDVWRNDRALPRFFAPTGVRALEPRGLAGFLHALEDARMVAVPARIPGLAAWPGDPFEVLVLEARAGRLRLQVSGAGERLVASSVPGPAGWQALGLPGRAALETVTINGAFLGVVVPPGISRLELRYRPPGFAWGVALGASGAALLLVAVWPRRRAQR